MDIADVIMGNRISQDQAAGNALGTTPFVVPILYDNQEVQPHVVGVVNQEHGLFMAEGAQAISTSIMAKLNLPVVQPMHWFTASESQKLVDTVVLTVLSTEFPEKLELDTDFWQEIRGALQSHRTPLSLKRRFRNIVGAVNLDDVENDVFHLTEFVTLGLIKSNYKLCSNTSLKVVVCIHVSLNVSQDRWNSSQGIEVTECHKLRHEYIVPKLLRI